MRCALVVGHKAASPGALNAARDLTEFEFNARLALDIWRRVKAVDGTLEIIPVFRRTYGELAGDVNAISPHLIVSMHCNAYDRKVSGTEVLYYHRSETGKDAAKLFQEQFVKYLELPNRGIRPVTREDRGGPILADTEAPAVLCEPFFIDNDRDLERALGVDMAGAYAGAIKSAERLV